MLKVAGVLDLVRDAIGVIGGDGCDSISLNGTLGDVERFPLKVMTFFFGVEGCLFSIEGSFEGFFFRIENLF